MTLSSLLPRSFSSLSLFLSYPSEQRVVAMEIAQALTNSGHRVFYDQDSLPAGGDYNERIRKAIEQADRVVFLATKNAFESGRYSLTELEFAKRRFPSPTGRVFPVLVDRSMKAEELPVYLRSVQAVTIHGSVVAETTAVIDETRTARRWCLSCVLLSAVLLVTAAGVALVPELIRRDPAPDIAPHAKVQPEELQPRQAIGASDSPAPPAQSYGPLAPALSQKNHVIGFTYRTSSTEIDPGLRVLKRQANGTWTNTYPSGFVDTSHEKARIELSGCTGGSCRKRVGARVRDLHSRQRLSRHDVALSARQQSVGRFWPNGELSLTVNKIGSSEAGFRPQDSLARRSVYSAPPALQMWTCSGSPGRHRRLGANCLF